MPEARFLKRCTKSICDAAHVLFMYYLPEVQGQIPVISTEDLIKHHEVELPPDIPERIFEHSMGCSMKQTDDIPYGYTLIVEMHTKIVARLHKNEQVKIDAKAQETTQEATA